MKKYLFILMTLVLGAFLIACDSQGPSAGDSDAETSHVHTYTCPMHPNVTSNEAGDCPECGMDLVLKEHEHDEEGGAATEAEHNH